MKAQKTKSLNWEICILAGGLSQRMGRDKSRLKLGKRTMLGQIRAEAKRTGLRVRVIRRDAVQRCGPLGGIYTALKGSRVNSVFFLACDMPFVSTEMMDWLLKKCSTKVGAHGIFARENQKAGFPFVVNRSDLPVVETQIRAGVFSIQGLAKKLKAKIIAVPARWSTNLRNVNTPLDWQRARQMLSRR